MKYFFSISIILLISLQSQAQKIRFTDTTNRWSIVQNWRFKPSTPWKSFFTAMKFSTPTMVNNKMYYVISGFTNSAWFREDTTNGIIYAKENITDTTEAIFFDYNLKVGDTFTCAFRSKPNTPRHKILIYNVDSVGINGIWHKRIKGYYLSGGVGNLDFIEGIGDYGRNPLILLDAEIWDNELPVGGRTSVYCFQNKGKIPTLDTGGILYNCFAPLKINNTNNINNELLIYPQPSSSSLTIELPENNSGTINIYDYIGKVVYTNSFDDKQKLTIERQPSGLYYYKLYTQNENHVYRGKVLFE